MLPSAAKAGRLWSIWVRAEARTLRDSSFGERERLMGFARRFRPTYAKGERGAPVQGARLAVGRV
jgi:hypothetical protein